MNQLSEAQFRATSGDAQAFGATPQQALKSLLHALPVDTPQPIVIWPFNRGDAFFTEAQQSRLVELRELPTRTRSEHDELLSLIEAAFDATIHRTKSVPHVKS
jgi:hypothetical protein